LDPPLQFAGQLLSLHVDPPPELELDDEDDEDDDEPPGGQNVALTVVGAHTLPPFWSGTQQLLEQSASWVQDGSQRVSAPKSTQVSSALQQSALVWHTGSAIWQPGVPVHVYSQ
jgi:hypothetical protein